MVSVDYKYIDLPELLDGPKISVKFLDSMKTAAAFCTQTGKYHFKFQYGTFPLFEYDEIHGRHSDGQIGLVEGTGDLNNKSTTNIQFDKSSKPGKWIFGSIIQSNESSQYVFLPFCQVYIKVIITGNVRQVDKALLLPPVNEQLSVNFSSPDTLIKLFTISNLTPLSKVSISNNSTTSIIVTFSSDGSMPPFIDLLEATDQNLVIEPNEDKVLLSPPVIEIEIKALLIRVRPLATQNYHISIHHDYETNDDTQNFQLNSILSKEYLGQHFYFRYFVNNSEEILFRSANPVILPFHIEPIKDQGGVLTVTASNLQKGEDLCVGDLDFMKSILMSSSQKVGYGGCSIKRKLNSIFKTAYPKAGWLYIFLKAKHKPSLVEVVSTRSCLNSCSRSGRCGIIFFDVGLLYTCQCNKRYWDASVVRPLRKGIDCSHVVPIDQKMIDLQIYHWWKTKKRRIILIITNITIIIAGLFAISRSMPLLGIVYLISGIASCLHHSYAETDTFDINVYPIVRNISNPNTTDPSFKVDPAMTHKFSVLDHIAAVVTIWTLCIELSSFKRYPIIELLNYCGLVAIALAGTFYKTKKIWFIIVPLVVGVIIMLFSWIRTSIRLKLFFPPIDWCLTRMIPGILISLVAFAMMRLSGMYVNYYYIYHSIWHVLIGLALLILLPQRDIWRRFIIQSSSIQSTRPLHTEAGVESINMDEERHIMKPKFRYSAFFEPRNCLVRKCKSVSRCGLSRQILKYFSKYRLFQYEDRMTNNFKRNS